jgi:nucleotide-binding universal stress UspA family protein
VAELARERVESVLLRSGRPLLLAPPKPLSVIGRKVALAWKAGAESARAVAVTLPILARAQEVSILTVLEKRGEDGENRLSAERLADYLRHHGIRSDVQFETAGSPAAQVVKDMAYARDADLLVMGGYGHGRMREFVFGGVTREILSDCALPVLMCG